MDVHKKRATLAQRDQGQRKPRFSCTPDRSDYYLWYVSEQEYPFVPFKKYFGMPRTSYLQLLMDLERNDAFQLWYSENHNAEKEPVELLLLGCLRVIKNRGSLEDEDFPAVSEDSFMEIMIMTKIEPAMFLRFYQYFFSFGFNELYSEYVQSSSFEITADMLEHINVFVEAGLFGTLGTKMNKRIRELRKRAT